MNIFVNGEFKIENSWGNRPSSKESNKSGKRPTSVSRPVSRQNKSLVEIGKKIINQIPDSLDTFVTDKILKDFQA